MCETGVQGKNSLKQNTKSLSFFFLPPSLACECFENSINVGGQSGRLQIQVRMLIEKTSVVSCFWWVVETVFKQRYTCPNV